jgi:hypothetical protein
MMTDPVLTPELFGDFGQYMSHKTHPKSFKRLLPPAILVETVVCPECSGEKQVEYERWISRSFQDDVGGFESYWTDCENCFGLGEIENDKE